MDRSLRLLLGLQAKSLWRRLTRGARTPKGAVFLVVGIAVFALWMWPSIFAARIAPRTNPDTVRAVTPVAILAACLLTVLTSGGERAIVFTPAEVDFLFSGPYTRRQILLYRIIKSSTGAVISALILSVVFLRHASSWPAAALAIVLGMLFLQYLGMVLLLIGHTIGERAHTWGRRIGVFVLLAVVVAPVIPTLMHGMGEGGGIVGFAAAVRASPVGRIVLLPVEPFGYLLTARGVPELAQWTVIAAAVNAALVFLIFWLDADYLESAAARSAVMQERIARARKLGIGAAAGGKVRFSPPMLPYWAGIGPVMWRQLTAAIRGSKGLLFILLLLAAMAAPWILSERRQESHGGQGAAAAIAGAMAWVTFVVSGMIKFDFRGDVDHMDVLKSLPISRWSLCAAQVAVPVLVLTAIHWLVVGAVLLTVSSTGPVLPMVAALSLPFNALVFIVENVAFLVYPVRGPQGAMDFQNFGRQTLFFLAKMIVLLIAGGIAAVAGLIAWVMTQSWLAVGAAALGILMMAVAGLLPLLVWAFERYDVSLDTPA
jgi:hypothetical protein